MSLLRTALLFVSVLYLKWTPSFSQCSNTTLVLCEGSVCPGQRRGCDHDPFSGKFVCGGCDRPNRDPCTCLTNFKGCHIEQNATNAVGRPTLMGRPQSTYSCVNSTASSNCNYDVHVLSTIRSNGDTISWATVLSAGIINVDISVSGGGNSNKALVLALLSHYPSSWVLNIPSGVIIDKILLSSYHLDVSNVTYPSGSVRSVERLSNKLLPSLANGFDEYGDHTIQALQYLMERFGSTTSFTGTFNADRFSLAIRRTSRQPECSLVPNPPVSKPPSPVLSAQCHPLISDSCFFVGTGARCSGDGYCRCPNDRNRDECTCLVKHGSCQIAKSIDGAGSAGVPSYQGRTQITYSCVANDNCQNSVHVISTYEARRTGGLFSVRAGSAQVRISVTGEDTSNKPLILVLTSYYPIHWSLSIPQGVTFDRIIVSSYFQYFSQTTVSGAGSAVVERITCSSTVQCYADGYDRDTLEQLQYISRRFGPVSTWSSAYRTNSWALNIERISGCTSSTSNSGSSRSCPVIAIPRATTDPPFRPSTPPSPFPTSTANVPSFATSLALSVALPFGLIFLAIFVLLIVCIAIAKCGGKDRPPVATSRFVSSHPPVVNSHPVSSRPLYTPRYPRDVHSEPVVNSRVIQDQQNDYQFSGGDSAPTYGVLMDSAPPSYLVALSFPTPAPKTAATITGTTNGKNENLESPPPYPG